jgi:DNA-binding transcriptional LysR family regulator
LELRHLRYFVAAAEELNFTRAAARLGIAQPPLTLQIRALEHEVGAALFDRLSRGVRLTDAGRALLTDAKAILDQVDQAVRRSRSSAEGVLGRVGVGFTVSASFHPLVNATLRTFRESFPKVDLQLEENRSTELLQSLQQGRIDAAFVRPPLTLTGELSMEPVTEEPMVAAVPLNHRLASCTIIQLRELSRDTFILYPRTVARGLSDDIVEACGAAGFEISAVQRAPQIASTINLVASGLGVSIVPACMRLSRTDSVRYIDLRGVPLRAHLGLAFRTGEPSAAVRNYLSLVRGRSAKVRGPSNRSSSIGPSCRASKRSETCNTQSA